MDEVKIFNLISTSFPPHLGGKFACREHLLANRAGMSVVGAASADQERPVDDRPFSRIYVVTGYSLRLCIVLYIAALVEVSTGAIHVNIHRRCSIQRFQG